MKKLVIVWVAMLAGHAAVAGMQITEWMYQGTNGEFVEFTNMGASAIDMTGWSYSDSARTAGSVSLSTFGVVARGESIIFTETEATAFRTAWNLSSSIKIIGSNTTQNLGRSDEINLYDAANTLIARLTYDDATGKGPRTQTKSCTIPLADLGVQTAGSSWVLASVGDSFNSYASAGNDTGNPGFYYAAIPEPASLCLLALGGFAVLHRLKKS